MCNAPPAGRQIQELVDIFSSQTESLSNYRCVNSDLYVSNLNGISLPEYCTVKSFLCKKFHQHLCCVKCSPMIQAACQIIDEGIVPMASVFRKVYPNVTYISANAKRRLLQLPIVAVRIVNSA